MISLLFVVAGLLLLIQLAGELEVELEALVIVFSIHIRGGFGLSLLEVDSERCSGNDARR